MFKKLKKDDKGSSFVLVIVTISLLMILTGALMILVILQFRMQGLNRDSKNNFYYLEQAMDQIRVGVGNESMEQLKTAYDETVADIVFYDAKKQKYMSVDSDTAMKLLATKFKIGVNNVFGTLTNGELQTKISNYILNEADNGISLKVGSDFGWAEIAPEAGGSGISPGYEIKQITLVRKHADYVQSITTDMTVCPPTTALNFLASNETIDGLFSYSVAADYGLNVVGTSTSANSVSIAGNVYAGADTRENGIYNGVKSLAVDTGMDEDSDAYKGSSSTNSGVYVNKAKLNVQGDLLVTSGSIDADNGAEINMNSKADDSSKSSKITVYAKNLVADGLGKSNIYMKTFCNVSDDLSIEGKNSTVQLDGQYYGYNYSSEDEATSTDKKDLIQYRTTKKHTNSSAVIVNGENAKLDLSKVKQMVVAGRSYIDLLNDSSVKTVTNEDGSKKKVDEDSKEVDDIQTGDSVTAKGNQLAYRATNGLVHGKDAEGKDTDEIIGCDLKAFFDYMDDKQPSVTHNAGYYDLKTSGGYIQLQSYKLDGEDYYFYLFNKIDGKEKFAKDYAKYAQGSSDVIDYTSDDVFPVKLIDLPDTSEGAGLYSQGNVTKKTEDGYEVTNPDDADNTTTANTLTWDNVATICKLKSKNFKTLRYILCATENNITADYQVYANKRFDAVDAMAGKDSNNVEPLSLEYVLRKEDGSYEYVKGTLSDDQADDVVYEKGYINFDVVKTKNILDEKIKGYNGSKVWVSGNDIVIDGKSSGTKLKGMIICAGNVTMKNVDEFNGIIVCAGKLNLPTSIKLYSDEDLCHGILDNDKENLVRPCFNLEELAKNKTDVADGETISSIEYTDLVGYDNWTKNVTE